MFAEPVEAGSGHMHMLCVSAVCRLGDSFGTPQFVWFASRLKRAIADIFEGRSLGKEKRRNISWDTMTES